MATTARMFSTLSLELEGQAAGSLRSCQPASLRVDVAPAGPSPEFAVRDGVRVVLGEMAAEADLADPGPLVDWLQATLAGDMATRSGAVVLADHTLNQRRRIAFRAASLTALNWPVLNAAEAKRPVTLGLRWLAETVDDKPASGKLKLAPGGKRKALLTSNFRVLGRPFNGQWVSRVALPSLSVSWAVDDRLGPGKRDRPAGQCRLGELVLHVNAREAEAARGWVHKLVVDGQVDSSEGLALQVEMLDPSLKNAMVTITLDGCLLRGLDEDPLVGNALAEQAPGLVLRFAVERLGLKLG